MLFVVPENISYSILYESFVFVLSGLITLYFCFLGLIIMSKGYEHCTTRRNSVREWVNVNQKLSVSTLRGPKGDGAPPSSILEQANTTLSIVLFKAGFTWSQGITSIYPAREWSLINFHCIILVDVAYSELKYTDKCVPCIIPCGIVGACATLLGACLALFCYLKLSWYKYSPSGYTDSPYRWAILNQSVQ